MPLKARAVVAHGDCAFNLEVITANEACHR